jgi:hypothetical protein
MDTGAEGQINPNYPNGCSLLEGKPWILGCFGVPNVEKPLLRFLFVASE